MKKTLPLLALFAALAASCPVPSAQADGLSPLAPVTAEVLRDTGMSPDELTALLNRMGNVYARDVKTPSGRVDWHGRLTSSVLDVETGCVIERYEDGAEFRFNMMKSAQQRVDEANSKLKTTLAKSGIPKMLEESRKREREFKEAEERRAAARREELARKVAAELAKAAAQAEAEAASNVFHSAESETSGATSPTPDGAAE